ncbi:Hypothetical protein A7982_05395 [Minicystis rosea]|nr:Hypothetical protein A7982_05395 [Minicystis rosea]
MDAFLPQDYDRAIVEGLVAAHERWDLTLVPPGESIWDTRHKLCARVQADGRGEAVLRVMHAALPAMEQPECFLRLVAEHGAGNYDETIRPESLTPVSATHLVELTNMLGREHISDVASWLWFADTAALERLQPIARAATPPERLDGLSSGAGEARVFELFAAAFADERAALRHMLRGLKGGAGRGACSAAAAWLVARHGLTLPAPPAKTVGWDGGVFELAVAAGLLLNAVDQAHPELLAEMAEPTLMNVSNRRRTALAARLFGRWDAAFSVTDGKELFEAACRRGVVYSRAGKCGKEGRVSMKVADPKKAMGEVEKKVAAKEKEWSVTRAPL